MAVIVNEQNQLEVLWALDVQDERLVDPQLAVRGKEYRCPGCRGNLIVRQGNKRRRHFAHKSADAGGCETYVHSTAKYLLQQVIQKTQHGGRVPVIQRSCDECGQENSGDLTFYLGAD